MDCFVASLLAMTLRKLKHTSAISPRIHASFANKRPAFRYQRAQGMPGARRARGLACKIK
jgi:hypothetical protein